MGFLNDLWNGTPDAAPVVVNHSLEQIFDDTIAGRSGTPGVLSIAAVFRARGMNADTMSSVPVMVGESPAPAPNPSQTVAEFINEFVLSLQDNGDCFVAVSPAGDMRVLPDDAVTVLNDPEGNQARLYRNNETGVLFRTSGMTRNLYVASLNRSADMLRGIGPVQNPRLAGILASQTYSEEYFKHHGKPSGVLKVPAEPTSDEARALKAQWDNARAVRSTAVISQQMDYTATSFSPDDSEWVETSKFSMLEVANLFGVPPVLLGASVGGSSLTYQAIGDVYQGYWRMTLAPTFAKRFVEMWFDVTGQTVRFDPENLFLASLRDRSLAAWQLTGMGYDPAGVLDVVGLPPIGHAGIPTTLQQPTDGSSDV